jgi:hypothetical protein
MRVAEGQPTRFFVVVSALEIRDELVASETRLDASNDHDLDLEDD